MDTSKEYFNLKGKNAENLVHELALKTFLTDWCYLNPLLPNGKELCDLLVVFDETAIIWQIKDLKLDKQGKYKEPEVRKNLRQLSGAHRQLFELETPIELENPRRGKEQFDSTAIKEAYLISVLLGEGEDIFSSVESIKGHSVHVFTRDFTQIILNELDTISDFTNYLRAKEARPGQLFIILGGEEELLAFYLLNNRSFERFDEADTIMIEQGSWEHLQNREEYKAKRKEDEISYYWDYIIGRAHEGSSEYELIARELARPNRFERRYLSKIFFDAHVRAHSDNQHPLFRRAGSLNGVTYCFLFADNGEFREDRKSMLMAMCWIARDKFQENMRVIGVATEKQIQYITSYDFVLLDIPELTEDNQKEIEKLKQETGILLNPTMRYSHEDEYPKLEKG